MAAGTGATKPSIWILTIGSCWSGVGDVYHGQLVRHRVSKLKASWLVAIWLEHLALSAAGKTIKPTQLLALDNGNFR